MSKAYRKYLVIILLLMLFLGIVVYGFCLYNKNLKADLSANACDTLEELTKQQRFSLYSKMDDDVSFIKNLAKAISSVPKDEVNKIEIINGLASNTKFEYMLLTDIDGKGFASNGSAIDISKRAYFQSVLKGKTILAYPMTSICDENIMVVPIAIPVLSEDEVIGILVGVYRVDNLNELILPIYKGRGTVYVTDSSGNIILKPQHDMLFSKEKYYNFFDIFESCSSNGDNGQDDIKINMNRSKSGHANFAHNEESVLVHYAPLGINDWYIFMVIPESIVSKQAISITKKSVAFTMCILQLLVLLILYIIWQQKKADKSKVEYMTNLERIAFYDELTGLPNLYKFKDLATCLLKENQEKQFAVVKFDIENFRAINEMFGFDVGSKVLQLVAEYEKKISLNTKNNILIGARITADEFIIIDEYNSIISNDLKSISCFENSINGSTRELLKGYKIEFQYGKYLLEKGELDISRAIENANLAYRRIKEQKVNHICDYNEELKTQFLKMIEIENKMQSALDNKEFKVFLQHKYSLKTKKVVGAEALVRWKEQNNKYILPGEFIPIFEKNGFVLKLDFYMFESVCELIRDWLKLGKTIVPISVNFSRMHLNNLNFVEELKSITDKYNVPRKFLEIEITESIFFENEKVMEELLVELHNAGFRLSMDDFGIGYSSLGLLKNLPIDVIKIDKSFFDNNKYKTRAKSVIESIMEMAQKLKINTVAEGVETREQIELLTSVGCDMVQGFYFSKPVPVKEFFEEQFKEQLNNGEVDNEELTIMKVFENCNIGKYREQISSDVFNIHQLAIKEILNERYGYGEMLEIFKMYGTICGRTFSRSFLDLNLALTDFLSEIKLFFENQKFGEFEFEYEQNDHKIMIITIRTSIQIDINEQHGRTICVYNQGVVIGILYEYIKTQGTIIESDCIEEKLDICKFKLTLK